MVEVYSSTAETKRVDMVALEAATQASFRAMAATALRMAMAVAQKLPPPRGRGAPRARSAQHLSSRASAGHACRFGLGKLSCERHLCSQSCSDLHRVL